ncbi:MAG: hypothetical protein FWG07_00925 [Treponema sp.]|nr:hypothetical protein [Treponema sp.]
MNKKWLPHGVTVLSFVVLIMVGVLCLFAGCVTYKWEETDTSRAIHEAASDLVRSRGGRISVNALISGLDGNFPGIKLQPLNGISRIQINANYGGTATWPTTYRIKCTWEEGNIVTGIISVTENRAAEK